MNAASKANKMTVIKANNLVEKQNILNEVKNVYLTLQEARLFAIYLSKINSRDMTTRVVKFKLFDFLTVLSIEKINISRLMEATNKLLSIIINLPNDKGGYNAFQLFKTCKVYKEYSNEWYIEIDAHDEALALMFDFKTRYFTYQVDNVLRLNSSNQMRMYEILKQYEYLGERILSVAELKEYLGIKTQEYPRFGDFRVCVLDVCKRALAQTTDIEFTYEPYGKRGKGGKIQHLKFIIQKNENYVCQLTFSEFTQQSAESEVDETTEENDGISSFDEKITFLAEACNNEFSDKEIIVLHNLLVEKLPHETAKDQIKCYDYLMRKYKEMDMRDEKSKIKHRFSYLKSLIGAE